MFERKNMDFPASDVFFAWMRFAPQKKKTFLGSSRNADPKHRVPPTRRPQSALAYWASPMEGSRAGEIKASLLPGMKNV